jgi:DNA polymerase I-like protein with 3'-5' exonuclease and polymerase domains
MIVAPKGKVLVSVDLSQAESWVVAHLAREPNMQYSLNKSDIHTDTAAALFYTDSYCVHDWKKTGDTYRCTKCPVEVVKTMRYIGKQYNHASSYRMKPPRAAQVINKQSDKPPFVTVTLSESKLYSERWHKRYNVKIWWAEIEQQLNQTMSLTTPYGRSRTFFAAWGDELFREATAYVPQSTVADHFNGMVHPELGVVGGLIEIRKRMVLPYVDRAIINQSHDSCILEVPSIDGLDVAAELQRLVRRPLVINGVEFTIPVDGEIGERLGELEKV